MQILFRDHELGWYFRTWRKLRWARSGQTYYQCSGHIAASFPSGLQKGLPTCPDIQDLCLRNKEGNLSISALKVTYLFRISYPTECSMSLPALERSRGVLRCSTEPSAQQSLAWKASRTRLNTLSPEIGYVLSKIPQHQSLSTSKGFVSHLRKLKDFKIWGLRIRQSYYWQTPNTLTYFRLALIDVRSTSLNLEIRNV